MAVSSMVSLSPYAGDHANTAAAMDAAEAVAATNNEEASGDSDDLQRLSSASPSTLHHPPPAEQVEFKLPIADSKPARAPAPEVSESTLRRRAAAAAAAERRLRAASRGSEEGFVAEETNDF